MSSVVLKRPVSEYVTKVAYSLMAAETSLELEDVRRLREEGPKLAKKVRNAKKGKPFEGFSEEDKRTLLAYVVYFRQNLVMEGTSRPNDEDAAKILHREVFKDKSKESEERLTEELIRQLQKAGLNVND